MPPPMRQHRSGRKWRTRQIIKGAAVLSFACFGTRCICCAWTVLPSYLKTPVLLSWFILKWFLFGMVFCWAGEGMLDSLGRYNSCCLMFSQKALEIDCACFLLCLCNNCICKFCVSLHLQRLYLVFMCVFVFATILFEISVCLCICNNCIW